MTASSAWQLSSSKSEWRVWKAPTPGPARTASDFRDRLASLGFHRTATADQYPVLLAADLRPRLHSHPDPPGPNALKIPDLLRLVLQRRISGLSPPRCRSAAAGASSPSVRRGR